ncbi:hypothetical protein MNBD_IGNAVI01-2584 [hydrothermal vent metagenome]|uniref:Heavy metal RND efflux outer membrane protein, CzcC family n=1 Tax=hydrothermal vent metagenome TaxID=652676 RepID=A0A3B1CTG7_9ZZZZ
MIKISFVIQIFISLILSQSVLSAQNAVIDLETAIRKAESNSYVIKSQKFEKSAAEQNYENQRSKTLPDLSLLLFRQDRFLSAYNFHQQSASLRSSWALGDLIMNSADVAKSESRIIESKIEQEKLSNERRVAGIYLQTLLKETEIEIQSKRLELMMMHRTVAEIGWKAGTRSKLDVLQSENEISKIEEEIERIKNEKEKLLSEFDSIVGNDSLSYELEPIEAEKMIGQLLPDTSILSVNENPFIKEFDYRANTEMLRKDVVTAQQLPALGFGGGYFFDGDPTGDGNYWQFNVGLKLPLFMWGSTDYQRQLSEAKILSLQSQKMNIQRELNIFYRKTFSELENYKEISKIQKEREAIAEHAFAIAQVDYKAGLITNLAFIDAQQSLAEIKIKTKETRLRYVAKLVDLYLAANKSDMLFTLLK